MTIIETILAAILAGLVLLFVERKFFKANDKKELTEAKIPQSNMPTKILTNEIIEAIYPERNYAKVKELLGLPDKSNGDGSIFEDAIYSVEELSKVKSDIYFLKNATLKVTTLDKRSIYSITVFSHDNKLMIPGIFYPCEKHNNTFGEARICQEIVTNARRIEPVRTIRDSAIAIQYYMGPPFYRHMTYFVDSYMDNEAPLEHKSLEGKEIQGFCLSCSDLAFYIYDYDLR